MALRDFFGFLNKNKNKKSRILKRSKQKTERVKKGPKKKNSVKRKPVSKKRVTVKKKKVAAVVIHRFSKIKVAVLKLRTKIKVGDTLHFKGHTSNFKQKVVSMQMDHASIKSASTGQEIGVRIKSRVRINDKVFLEQSS